MAQPAAGRYLRMPGQRRGSTVLVDTIDNQIYHQNGHSSFRCAQFHSHFCRARLVFRDGRYERSGEEHSHDWQADAIQANEMLHWARARAANGAVPLIDIYMDAQERYQ